MLTLKHDIDIGTTCNIFLVGFSGTGKTIVGREVARLLGWEFVDTDGEIERKAEKPVRRIFAEDGEPAFRLLEKQALQDACSDGDRVVATGGGIVVDQENRQLMLGRGYLVCLDAHPETIFSRLTGDGENSATERPLLSGPNPLERIRALKASRQVYYDTAHCTVRTEGITVERVAQEVVKACRLHFAAAKRDHP